MKPTTHIPLHEQDPNTFIMVSQREGQVTENFSYNELHNPKTGLAAHPLSRQVVDAMQLIRTVAGVAMNANSTYRNYIPNNGVNPASKSPHMLACAFDSSFLSDTQTNQALYVAIREDFDKKGPLFQHLWAMGVRGFGSYDTFIHLDTVRSELYGDFRSKRRSVYQGKFYARWNNMKELYYQKATMKFVDQDGQLALVPIDTPQEVAIVRSVKKVAGVIKGTLNELFDNEDQGKDFTYRQGIWMTGAAIALLVIVYAVSSKKTNLI